MEYSSCLVPVAGMGGYLRIRREDSELKRRCRTHSMTNMITELL